MDEQNKKREERCKNNEKRSMLKRIDVISMAAGTFFMYRER